MPMETIWSTSCSIVHWSAHIVRNCANEHGPCLHLYDGTDEDKAQRFGVMRRPPLDSRFTFDLLAAISSRLLEGTANSIVGVDYYF